MLDKDTKTSQGSANAGWSVPKSIKKRPDAICNGRRKYPSQKKLIFMQHKSTNDTTHQHTMAHGSKNIVALVLRDTHK